MSLKNLDEQILASNDVFPTHRSRDMSVIEAEAALWVARLDNGSVSDGDRAAFHVWCESDERHFRVAEQLIRLYSEFELLKGSRQ